MCNLQYYMQISLEASLTVLISILIYHLHSALSVCGTSQRIKHTGQVPTPKSLQYKKNCSREGYGERMDKEKSNEYAIKSV